MKLLIILILLSYKATAKIPHRNAGCPENSTCSKELGALLTSWENILATKSEKLINQFIQNNGLLLSGYTTSNKSDELIITDSSCLSHRKNDPVIFHASTFLKLSNKEQDTNFLAVKAYTFNSKTEKIESFIIPRRNIPTLVTNEGIVVLIEHEGMYFNLLQSEKHNTVNFKTYPYKEMIEVKCDEKLVKKFSEDNTNKIYSDSFCKGIWNETTGKHQIFLMGLGC